MRILYASDTHVHPAHLGRLLGAAEKLRPDAVILGGDINPNWKGSVGESIEPHRRWLRERFLPPLQSFHREHPEIQVFLDLGNDDIAASRPLLEQQDGKDFHLLHMKVLKLSGDLAVAGYMAVNPTPFHIKDWEKPDSREWDGLSEPGVARTGFTTHSGVARPGILDPGSGTMEDDLEVLSTLLESAPWKDSRFIFVSHAPPRNTALDRTGMNLNVGSLAVRRFIERWAPSGRLVCSLHGHIHESPRMSGRTWQLIGGAPCFNMGQQRETLRALLMDSSDPAGTARLVMASDPRSPVVGQEGELL